MTSPADGRSPAPEPEPGATRALVPVPAPAPAPAPAAAPAPRRIAAAWFLGCIGFAFVVLLWLRGAGRLLLPIALVALFAWVVVKVVRKVQEPVS